MTGSATTSVCGVAPIAFAFHEAALGLAITDRPMRAVWEKLVVSSELGSVARSLLLTLGRGSFVVAGQVFHAQRGVFKRARDTTRS